MRMVDRFEYTVDGLRSLDKLIIEEIGNKPALESELQLSYLISQEFSFLEFRVALILFSLKERKTLPNKKEDFALFTNPSSCYATLNKCAVELEKMKEVKEFQKSAAMIGILKKIGDARNFFIHYFAYHSVLKHSSIGKEDYSENKIDFPSKMAQLSELRDFYGAIFSLKKVDLRFCFTGKKDVTFERLDFRGLWQEMLSEKEKKLSDLRKEIISILTNYTT